VSDDDLSQVVIADAKDRMDKAIDHTRGEFSSVRSGRATPGLVEHLRISVYGSEVELRTIAGLSVPEARLLVISPYDKSSIGAIEKAIQTSDLGINPSNDGLVIRLAFPPLTEERRKELVKVVKHKAEEGRVAIRNLRRSARHELDQLESDGDLSSDEVERAEKELERLTHEKVGALEGILSHKEQELLEL
jgi:ribosome recycling factor